MNVLMISPGYPGEMPHFAAGLAAIQRSLAAAATSMTSTTPATAGTSAASDSEQGDEVPLDRRARGECEQIAIELQNLLNDHDGARFGGFDKNFRRLLAFGWCHPGCRFIDQQQARILRKQHPTTSLRRGLIM